MSSSPIRKYWPILVIAAIVAIATTAYRFAPTPRSTLLDRASSAYGRGDYREARIRSLEILAKSPDNPEALRVMARASARLGNDDSAQALYARIGERAMEPEDFFALGSSLERRGQASAAVAVFERGRTLGPDHAETLQGLARLYARQARILEAIDAAGRLSECPGWEARGALILGVLDVEHADSLGAAATLERALKTDPKLTGGMTSPIGARKLLAGALLRTARPGPALEALKPILASGDDPEAAWLSGRAFLQAKDVVRAKEALALAGDFGKDDPTRPEPAAYVGAGACAGCHAAIHRAQRSSRHSRTFSAVADLETLALPSKPIVDKILPGTSHTLRREGDAIRLTTRSSIGELTALIEYAVGSGDRGLTMVARDSRGLARVCRVSSYLGGTLWDLTSNADNPHPDDPGGPMGRPMSAGASETCVGCHVTSLRAARDRRVPEASDRGIGCEQCHGPGGNHLVAMNLGFPDLAIARPSRGSADQINRVCGACHRADDPSTRETDPRFVRFQATTLPLSRCYSESLGSLSCVTCHDPHRDAETKPEFYEARCLACHGTGSNSARLPNEDRHPSLTAEVMRRVVCPVNPALNCLGCHMPKVEGAAPYASFTDHQIRVHKSTRSGE